MTEVLLKHVQETAKAEIAQLTLQLRRVCEELEVFLSDRVASAEAHLA